MELISNAIGVPTQSSSKAQTVSAKNVYNRLLSMMKLLKNGGGQPLTSQNVSQSEYTTLQTVSTTSLPTPIPTTTMEIEPTELEDKVTTPSATLTSSPGGATEEVPQATLKAINTPTPASMTTLIPRNSLHNRLLGLVKMLSSRSRVAADKHPSVLKHGTWSDQTTLSTVSATSPTAMETSTMEVESTELEATEHAALSTAPATSPTTVPTTTIEVEPTELEDRLTTEAMTTYTTSSPAAETEGQGQAEEVSTAIDVPTPAPMATSVTGNDPYRRLRNMVKMLALRSRMATDGFRSGTLSQRTTLQVLPTSSLPPTTTIEVEPTELEDIVTTPAATTTTTPPAVTDTEEAGRADGVPVSPFTMTAQRGHQSLYNRLLGMVNMLSMRRGGLPYGHPGVHRDTDTTPYPTTTTATTTTTTTTTTTEEPQEAEDVLTSTTITPVTTGALQGGQGVYSRLMHVFKMLSARNRNIQAATTRTTTSTTTTTTTEEPPEEEESEEAGGSQDYEYEY